MASETEGEDHSQPPMAPESITIVAVTATMESGKRKITVHGQ